MRAGVVHSQDVDSVDAVAELIAGAKVELGSSLPRLAILFAGIDHDFKIVLERLAADGISHYHNEMFTKLLFGGGDAGA